MNFDFDRIVTKMSCDQYIQHKTNFGVALNKSLGTSSFNLLDGACTLDTGLFRRNLLT